MSSIIYSHKYRKTLLVFLVAAVILVVYFVVSFYQKGQVQDELLASVNQLTVPDGCIESSRDYTSSKFLGPMALYQITYSCNTTNEAAHSEIISSLRNSGYAVLDDYSTKGPGYFYSFTYSKSDVQAAYTFDGSDRSVPAEQKPALDKAIVTRIDLSVSHY